MIDCKSRLLALMLALLPLGAGGALIKGSPPASDFRLERADGGEYQLSDRKGRVVLLYFGFTHCPHVCPQTMLTLSRLAVRLTEDELSRFDIVFISVDPNRDTPARVRDFTGRFEGRIIGLIPDPSQLERLRADYRLVARELKESGREGYDIVHTDFVYSVDSRGRLRHAFFSDTGVDSLLQAVRELLAEPY
jgi:protein SCO1/2